MCRCRESIYFMATNEACVRNGFVFLRRSLWMWKCENGLAIIFHKLLLKGVNETNQPRAKFESQQIPHRRRLSKLTKGEASVCVCIVFRTELTPGWDQPRLMQIQVKSIRKQTKAKAVLVINNPTNTNTSVSVWEELNLSLCNTETMLITLARNQSDRATNKS